MKYQSSRCWGKSSEEAAWLGYGQEPGTELGTEPSSGCILQGKRSHFTQESNRAGLRKVTKDAVKGPI